MAKMFYKLSEAAEKLGVDEQTVRDMAARGELQQFRDRDELMFKRDQIDAKAADSNADTVSAEASAADMTLDESGTIALADSSEADVINLAEDTGAGTGSFNLEDSREATGVSVFDAGEVEPADPLAQTQVTEPMIDDEDLALESVGSGSGLLDLTRESDDTSLGAELLDDIYTGSDTGSDIKMDSAVGSSGVFDSAVNLETAESSIGSLDTLSEADGPAVVETAAAPVSIAAEAYDGASSGFSAGMLLGSTLALIAGLIVMVAALGGVPSKVETLLISEPGEFAMVGYAFGGLLVLSIIAGVVGLAVGKATE
ncbi:MAG: helix-turn-helix domain-containing protein [Planctomycetota bacterium]